MFSNLGIRAKKIEAISKVGSIRMFTNKTLAYKKQKQTNLQANWTASTAPPPHPHYTFLLLHPLETLMEKKCNSAFLCAPFWNIQFARQMQIRQRHREGEERGGVQRERKREKESEKKR